jgi:5'-nucleotidase
MAASVGTGDGKVPNGARRRLVVLVDMDGVCADLDAELLRVLKERKQENVFHAVDGRKEFEYDATVDAACKTIMAEPGFYERLPPIPGAVSALQAMQAAGHDVWFCTSPLRKYRYCVPEKYAWVERHLGMAWTRRIIVTPDKTLVHGDYLVDDNPNPKGSAKTPSWTHVVFDQSYNRAQPETKHKPRLTRWSEWATVIH